MNRRAHRLMADYMSKLAIGDEVTIYELAEYVNDNTRYQTISTDEASYFCRRHGLERVGLGVWRKVR